MRVASTSLTTSEIIDEIYDACTLEDAIHWREQFVARLAHAISRADKADPGIREEVALYALAKAQAEQAISRLQMCIARNEHWISWSPR